MQRYENKISRKIRKTDSINLNQILQSYVGKYIDNRNEINRNSNINYNSKNLKKITITIMATIQLKILNDKFYLP